MFRRIIRGRTAAIVSAAVLFAAAAASCFSSSNTVFGEEEGGSLSGFARGFLDEEEKLVYSQLYSGIAERRSKFSVSASSTDKIGNALSAILTDCPEFFWIDGSAEMSGFQLLGVWEVSLGFNIPEEEIDSAQEVIDRKTGEFLASLPEGAGDYAKTRAAYEYIIGSTDYVYDSPQNQNIQSVFLYGESVCAGYARAFKYLLDRAGVDCAYVEGSVTGGEDEGHAWNLVSVNGVNTYVDPSWGDPTYRDDDSDEGRLSIIYDYLCLTGSEMERAGHTPAYPDRLPECEDRTYDYYVLNGMFYDWYDRDEISRAVWHAVDEGETSVFMKFAGQDDYMEALSALFPEDGEESLLAAPIRQRMEWDEVSSMRYYYSTSDELRIIKVYW